MDTLNVTYIYLTCPELVLMAEQSQVLAVSGLAFSWVFCWTG